MTEHYKKRLIELAKQLSEYKDTTDCKDYTYHEKVRHLIGYIYALDLEGQ